MRPFQSKEALHRVKRSIKQYRSIKLAKKRDPAPQNPTKTVLLCSLLNVDGLTEASLHNVEDVVGSQKPDVVILLETKRRL